MAVAVHNYGSVLAVFFHHPWDGSPAHANQGLGPGHIIAPFSFPSVPPSQEEKYKYYYNQLTHLVREYEGVVGRLEPTIKPLLRPHLEDMERKVAPGFSLLTWTSMNVDGYLHRFKQVCMGGD